MNTSDQELVKNYLESDEESFKILVSRYLKPVYNLVHQMTGNVEWANDISQETFLKVWRNLKKYDTNKKFSTWILTIARNTALDWLKKRKISFFSELDNEDMAFEETLVSEELLPDEIFERKEFEDKLNEALLKLSPLYRSIIVLHNNFQMTFEEISEALGEPMNTVKSQYRRAIIQLKKLMHQN